MRNNLSKVLKCAAFLLLSFFVSVYIGTWLSHYLSIWIGIDGEYNQKVGYIIYLVWIISVGLLLAL